MKRWISLVFTVVLAGPAWAGVAEDCQSAAATEASHACDTYIEGFIAGALLTDAAIIQSLEKTEGSAFMDRAYRTRLGQPALPPTYLASYCLPELPMDQMIADIRSHMAKVDPQQPLGEVVYAILKKHYPCE